MTQVHTRRILMTAGAIVAAVAIAGPSASAQTTTTAAPAAATTAAATTAVKKPTATTQDMIKEAVQRSQARAAKFKCCGVPEQWGSEEPFTFDPAKP